MEEKLLSIKPLPLNASQWFSSFRYGSWTEFSSSFLSLMLILTWTHDPLKTVTVSKLQVQEIWKAYTCCKGLMLRSSTSACDSDSTVALQSWNFPKNTVPVLAAVFQCWSQGLQNCLWVPNIREGKCSPELWPESKCWHNCTPQRTVLPRGRQQHLPGTRCLLPVLNSQAVRTGGFEHPHMSYSSCI